VMCYKDIKVVRAKHAKKEKAKVKEKDRRG